MSLSPVDRSDTLTETVYAQIQNAIVSRALQPGARLTEAGIAKELQVSKTPVREALLKLREVGLIEPDGARSNRVVTPSPKALRDAYEARRVLERFTAQTTADRATPESVALIKDLAASTLQHAQARDREGFREADQRLHIEIARSAGNARIQKLIADATTLIQALRQRDLPNAESVVACGQSHVRIADAIERRDGEAAGEEMRQHLLYVERYILELDGDPEPGEAVRGLGPREQLA